MNIEEIEYLNYTVKIIYQPFFDDSTPRSKQYQLIIEKGGVELTNRYGLTYNGAKTWFKRWIDKQYNCSSN